MTLEFPLMPVAALIRPGHRLCLAIAGADKDWFTVYSSGGPERFDVRLGEGGSQVTLPARPWRCASDYRWRSKYGGMDVTLMTRMKELEEENRRLKKL
jgi:hypothetical protein